MLNDSDMAALYIFNQHGLENEKKKSWQYVVDLLNQASIFGQIDL